MALGLGDMDLLADTDGETDGVALTDTDGLAEIVRLGDKDTDTDGDGEML